MKKRSIRAAVTGFLAGVLVSTSVFGIGVYAKSTMQSLDVYYNNIKVYKDRVLYELKDANGKVIEPFIYEGTTYLPVRGTANLADMDVTWDGSTYSVYLWDKQSPSETSLMEVCPPYSTHGVDLFSDGKTFTMDGKTYSNGFRAWSWYGNAVFNLDGKYQTLHCTVGHTNYINTDKTISFIVDGKTVKTVDIKAGSLAQEVSVPLSYGLQLKIAGNGDQIGVANLTVE